MSDSTHERLLEVSAGYREFVAEERETEIESVRFFASWLALPSEAPSFSEWTAERFREEWDFWHS